MSEARVLDVTVEQYHADPCDEPALSASIATTLIQRSPLHAWSEHPRLGGVRREPSATFDRGSLIHKLILGKGADVVVIKADHYRTKAAQEQRDEARVSGRIPVLEADYHDALAATAAISVRLRAQGVELDGESEVAIAWREPVAGGSIWCRGMLDHVTGATIYDLKSTRNAHPDACRQHVINYGYTIQRAAYIRALTALRPELAGRIDFAFLFVELEFPYVATVARLDAILREHGERAWTKAAETWAGCLRRNDWPAAADGPVILEAPPWLLSTMEAM